MYSLTGISFPPCKPEERAVVAISLSVIEFCLGDILELAASPDNSK